MIEHIPDILMMVGGAGVLFALWRQSKKPAPVSEPDELAKFLSLCETKAREILAEMDSRKSALHHAHSFRGTSHHALLTQSIPRLALNYDAMIARCSELEIKTANAAFGKMAGAFRLAQERMKDFDAHPIHEKDDGVRQAAHGISWIVREIRETPSAP